MLGSSENLVGNPSLFHAVDKKRRIFQRKPVVIGPPITFPLTDPVASGPVLHTRPRPLAREPNLGTAFERLWIELFAPGSVIVDERGDILYYCGHTGDFLEPSVGAPSSNLLSMARRGLRLNLRTALHEAVKKRKQVVHQGVSVQTAGGVQVIDLIVRPLIELGAESSFFIVVFKRAFGRLKHRRPRAGQERGLAEQLEGELQSTKEHLQTTIGELETSNEELKSSNEELLSMNEELQSANEELQTSKEELQSVNEELETVNAELRSKFEELDGVNSDLQNLLQSTQIATVFLDNSLRIKKFTAAATEVFRLIDTDLGRPITDITPRFLHTDLEQDIRTVLRKLAPSEHKVQLIDHGGWCLMRISPYRTLDHVIQGVVMTFVDVTELEDSRARTAQLATVVSSTPDAIFTTTLEGQIMSWNRGAERIYGWTAAEMIGRNASILLPPEHEAHGKELLARLARGEEILGLETVRMRKDGSRVDMSLTLSPLRGPGGEPFVSVVARDITAAKSDERALRRANEALKRANEDLQHLSYAASHDLQEPLRMVSNYAQLLSTSHGSRLDEEGREYLGWIVNGSLQLHELLQALKKYWSLERTRPEPKRVDTGAVLATALRNLKQTVDENSAVITSDEMPTVMVHETAMLELFQNLLGNALKYHRNGISPRVHIGVRETDEGHEFAVVDNGVGVPPPQAREIFLPFKRLHSSVPGTGMGLAICSLIVERFGGRIWVESRNDGATFRFTLPREQ